VQKRSKSQKQLEQITGGGSARLFLTPRTSHCKMCRRPVSYSGESGSSAFSPAEKPSGSLARHCASHAKITC
jgi:hypothetical protein